MASRNDQQHRVNDRIRAREVRLIGPDGDQLGIKPVPEALRMARGLDLDLVEVAPAAKPPVCRIMDYGKFRYEEAQKAKEARKKSTQTSIKEVKFRPKIGKGDFNTKVRHLTAFLNDGHKVKVTLQLRGRERDHPELGKKVLDEVLDEVDAIAKVDNAPRLEGRVMTMMLSPDKQAQEALAKQRAQQEQQEQAAAAEATAAEADSNPDAAESAAPAADSAEASDK